MNEVKSMPGCVRGNPVEWRQTHIVCLQTMMAIGVSFYYDQ